MKSLPTVYVETSALSVLVARKSRNSVTQARQTLTRAWWKRRSHFALFTSQAVKQEALQGDPSEVKKRLALAGTLSFLKISEEAETLALTLITKRVLPLKAQTDALHLAIAAVNKMEFLVSWNCRHLVNGQIQQQVYRLFQIEGYNMPDIRTPEGLLNLE